MPRKRDVLETLKLDELFAAADRLDVPVRDRRVRDELIEALAASRKAGLPGILEGLSRNRLKEICRALDLDDSGREKALLIDRLAGQDGHAAPTNAAPVPGDQPGDQSSDQPTVRPRARRSSRRETANGSKDKSLESWIWDVACSIRGVSILAGL